MPAGEVQLRIPHSKISEWNVFMREIREDWMREVPMRINTSATDQGHGLGGPEFSPEFVSYIGFIECGRPGCDECASERRKLHRRANPESRTRATRAVSKLRRLAPREFDVVYSVCILGLSVEEMADQLTGRGHRVYTLADVTILLMSGIDKVIHFWRSA